MRFDGKIVRWDDARGFGYIEPLRGGQDIFVHISAFKSRRVRPSDGQAVTFEVETHDGKKRAKSVQAHRKAASARVVPQTAIKRGGQVSGRSLLAIPAFVAVFLVVQMLWHPPVLVALLYLWVSFATFVVYAVDKSAAKSGDRRIAESKLHMAALMGGWPGALLAQRFLRHKSTKLEFQQTFKVTMFLNVVSFVLLCSPMGQRLWSH